jgi:UDPglucose 6-dehydrogenase
VKPEDYKNMMRTPIVFDGRNIYKVDEMKEAGVEYYSIGRTAVRSASPVLV